MRWIPCAILTRRVRSLWTNADSVTVYPALELVLDEREVEEGLAAMEADGKALYEKFRREMKTEEAYRLKSMVEQVVEETRSGD